MKQPLAVSVRRANAQGSVELYYWSGSDGQFLKPGPTLGDFRWFYCHILEKPQAKWEALGWRCRGFPSWDSDFYLLGEWAGSEGLPVKPD